MSVKTIMNQDESGKELVDFAQSTAKTLVRNNLKNAQLRNVFSEVRQVQALWRMENNKEKAIRRLSMLKPKLYYQSARERAIEPLRDVLCEAIDEVVKAPAEKQDEVFQRFVDLNEAILAFHKAEGGLG